MPENKLMPAGFRGLAAKLPASHFLGHIQNELPILLI
jgi:hypothetical protein